MKIVPSIIAHDQREFDERFAKVRTLSKELHLDVMDGLFVKQTSCMFELALPKKIKIEAHLMMQRPETWLKKYITMIDCFIVHSESEAEILKLKKMSHEHKKQFGLAISPGASLKILKNYIDRIDRVLVMTVQPGAYGGTFVPKALETVQQLREWNTTISIGVDGAMTPERVKKAKAAGANSCVVGSYLQEASSVEQAWKSLSV